MPKRKGADDSAEDNFSEGNAEQDEESEAVSTDEAAKKSRKKKGPAAKKAKSAPEASSSEKQSSTAGGKAKVNNEGDKYIDLGKKKRAVVRAFKGMALIDIREYYGAEGEEKPGKKGISLTPEQWKVLKENSDQIDTLLSELEKKK